MPHAERELDLPVRSPFDGAALLAYLARRAVRGIESVDGDVYTRSLPLPHGAGVVRLTLGTNRLAGRVVLDDERDLAIAAARCIALLDLDRDPRAVSDTLNQDPMVGPLRRSAPGMRVPGTVDGPELAVRAVLGQQISLSAAATAAARLVVAHGEPLTKPWDGVTHLFPTPHRLAAVDPATLAMPQSRARALVGLGDRLAAGDLALDSNGDRERGRAALLALPGIGPWTAEYVAMRALRDPDAFLASDLGVRRALERRGHDASPRAAERLSERWRPYRAYALVHLWADLATAG